MEQQHGVAEPLLLDKEKSESGKWSSYQYMRRGSAIPTASATGMTGSEVSVDEIRSAATHSDRYPPSLHAPLVSSPESNPNEFEGTLKDYDAIGPNSRGAEQALVHQGAYGGGYGDQANQFQRQVFDEVEIRELLIDHVGHRCCWGSRPARTYRINSVEDCNVYVGSLETFTEEREVIKERVPYVGGSIDGRESGPELGVWEMDLRDHFPVLFVPEKETRLKIPHSEVIEKCSGCDGRGDVVCQTCNKDKEPGFYKENQMSTCPSCHGRGLIAHRDGSDTICVKCNGQGKMPCATCGSRGLIKCEVCQGSGSLLSRSIAIVKWKTLSVRRVRATTGASSVPDEIFHRARGVQLCNTQAYQCTPAFFADSYFLNNFSSEVIAERPHIAPATRVICERHSIYVVPVTRVTMTHHRGRSSFSFYIVGLSKEVYLKDYYPARFCWGLCPCLEWLKL